MGMMAMDEQGNLRKKIADSNVQIDELNRSIRRYENAPWKKVTELVKSIKTNEKDRQIMFDDLADAEAPLQQLYAQRRNLVYTSVVDTVEADSLQRDHELLILELRR